MFMPGLESISLRGEGQELFVILKLGHKPISSPLAELTAGCHQGHSQSRAISQEEGRAVLFICTRCSENRCAILEGLNQ